VHEIGGAQQQIGAHHCATLEAVRVTASQTASPTYTICVAVLSHA
jgi:hypothetical protein